MNGVVFGKVGGDVNVWLVWIEHFEMVMATEMGEMVMRWGFVRRWSARMGRRARSGEGKYLAGTMGDFREM